MSAILEPLGGNFAFLNSWHYSQYNIVGGVRVPTATQGWYFQERELKQDFLWSPCTIDSLDDCLSDNCCNNRRV